MKRSHFHRVLFISLLAGVFIYANAVSGEKEYEAKISLLSGKELLAPVLRDIGNAEEEILCAIYMFKTDDGRGGDTNLLRRELERAVERGIRVRILFDVEDRSGSIVNRFNKDTGEELAEAGADVHYDDPERRLHTKMMVIDRKVTYTGSHNYTYSAFNFNDEVTARVVSQGFAEEAARHIEDMME
ncbi:phospholipase D-like domain-containing protein [Limisalsivibrio acetivorans]|uniref:phospholipase D-like domain-containing protein n=1 Tax=Limisalsivibrio acetivorans TaxID=1304888 RepID=UPI0003B65422|nr:phospholipase D-like domain-containing protein [Limisalsivibrio acetivorans]